MVYQVGIRCIFNRYETIEAVYKLTNAEQKILEKLKFINFKFTSKSDDIWRVLISTDTNNHNSCITKHILPYGFNICFLIYLKLIEINEIDIPDANISYLC